jgi:hypothetical protein
VEWLKKQTIKKRRTDMVQITNKDTAEIITISGVFGDQKSLKTNLFFGFSDGLQGHAALDEGLMKRDHRFDEPADLEGEEGEWYWKAYRPIEPWTILAIM